MEKITVKGQDGTVRLHDKQINKIFDFGIRPSILVDALNLLHLYEETGLTPWDIRDLFSEKSIFNLAGEVLGLEPSRLCELIQAKRDGRLVVLTEGDDTAALAATVDNTGMIRAWCGGDSDLLIGLLSILAGEVAKKAGTTYRTLLITMAKRLPVGDGFKEKRTEEGKK